jgi:hypothetical protein
LVDKHAGRGNAARTVDVLIDKSITQHQLDTDATTHLGKPETMRRDRLG